MKASKQIKLKGKLKTYMMWPIYSFVILVVANLAMFFVDVKWGTAMLSLTGVFFVVMCLLVFKMRQNILRSVVDFAVGYSQVQKEMLKELEIPYGILDEDAKFLWINDAFTEALAQENPVGRHIYSVMPQIPKEVIPKFDDAVNTIKITYNDRAYKVELKRMDITELINSGDLVDTDVSSYLISVYLFDETEINQYIQHIEDEKFVAGLVYIDNYDEALESIEEVRRSLLVGLVDRKINKYFSQGGAVIKKLEKDKFLVTMRNKFLMQLHEEKFNILEEVKAVSIGNEKGVTISIGIGAGEDSYLKNYEVARAAIDLALGRGGDQVVIKELDKVTYYGGKSQGLEKNTRVKARVKAHALREIIENKDKIIVMGHNLGDVDSFGAAVGIYRAAKALNKRAYIVAENITSSVKPLKDKFLNNPDYEEDMMINGEKAIELVDANCAVVVVDVNKPSLTECPELLEKCRTKVVIDHHRQSNETIEGAVLSYIEPFASSSCEMVAEILQYIKDGIRLKAWEADVLYAGMIIDTNNFTNKSGVRTFEAAAFLKRCGADTVRVRKLLRNDMRDYKARADAIAHAQIFHEDFVITVCKSEGLESPTVVAAQVANELLDVSGIKASFVITSFNDVIYVSARSIDELNVQLVMEKLGGGGHMNIAGAQLRNCSVEEALKLVRETMEELVDNNEI